MTMRMDALDEVKVTPCLIRKGGNFWSIPVDPPGCSGKIGRQKTPPLSLSSKLKDKVNISPLEPPEALQSLSFKYIFCSHLYVIDEMEVMSPTFHRFNGR